MQRVWNTANPDSVPAEPPCFPCCLPLPCAGACANVDPVQAKYPRPAAATRAPKWRMRFIGLLFYCCEPFADLDVGAEGIRDEADRQIHVLGLGVTLAVELESAGVQPLAEILEVLGFKADAVEGASAGSGYGSLRFHEQDTVTRNIGVSFLAFLDQLRSKPLLIPCLRFSNVWHVHLDHVRGDWRSQLTVFDQPDLDCVRCK